MDVLLFDGLPSPSATRLPHNSFEARYVRLQNATPEFG